ncbi:MAG: lytic transglycosylase domain-containing protein [Rhizobiaceae bacterium]|nr:lytic transglycosylase domain-containing protein [Rhizobiaceae bacterium]
MSGPRNNTERSDLPTAKSGVLTGLVLCAGFLAGCSTTRLQVPSDIVPLSDPKVFSANEALASGERSVVLPETVAVVPSSYAGSTPGGDSYRLASLPGPARSVGPQSDDATDDVFSGGRFPNENPARDVFPEAPEPGIPDDPAGDIVWQPKGTPRGEVDRLIAKYAAHYEVPESLVRRVVKRESNFNPKARNGPYWGLMQILHQTAKGMGYDGNANGLLDAETNLKYAVKYLRGAYLVADGNHDMAVRYYARGYYYDAKRRGLLEATGLGKDRKRKRSNQSA